MEITTHPLHEPFMRRTLELARLGAGSVSPNPLVGCVIVREGTIIGEGWHKQFGGPHAEVNAIASVADKNLLKDSTVYVNLEPCAHVGKTPPCADLLIYHGVPEVVIGNMDSNPLVAGKGAQKLHDAGTRVITGVLSEEGHELNRRFFTYMEKKRPYIILKWAQTADGFIARENKDSRWISDEYSRQLVHKWRTEEDAILVGTGTAVHDNPRLNVRDWTGRDPVRVLIDKHLKVPAHHHFFEGTQITLCYTLIKEESSNNVVYIRLQSERFLHALLDDLYTRRIQSVIVEGGKQVLDSFISSGLWDEARIFISPQRFSRGLRAPVIAGETKYEQKLYGDWLRIITPTPQFQVAEQETSESGEPKP